MTNERHQPRPSPQDEAVKKFVAEALADPRRSGVANELGEIDWELFGSGVTDVLAPFYLRDIAEEKDIADQDPNSQNTDEWGGFWKFCENAGKYGLETMLVDTFLHGLPSNRQGSSRPTSYQDIEERFLAVSLQFLFPGTFYLTRMNHEKNQKITPVEISTALFLDLNNLISIFHFNPEQVATNLYGIPIAVDTVASIRRGIANKLRRSEPQINAPGNAGELLEE